MRFTHRSGNVDEPEATPPTTAGIHCEHRQRCRRATASAFSHLSPLAASFACFTRSPGDGTPESSLLARRMIKVAAGIHRAN